MCLGSDICNQTGTHTNQPDDNWSWVTYQTRSNAVSQGIAAINNGEVYLGVDHTNYLNPDPHGSGRPSLRLQSKQSFEHGLLITRFTHLPEPVCGGWPG